MPTPPSPSLGPAPIRLQRRVRCRPDRQPASASKAGYSFATLTAATRYPVARWWHTTPVPSRSCTTTSPIGALRYLYQDATGFRNCYSDAWSPSTATTYHIVVAHNYSAETVSFYVNGSLLSTEDVSAFGVPVQIAVSGFCPSPVAAPTTTTARSMKSRSTAACCRRRASSPTTTRAAGQLPRPSPRQPPRWSSPGTSQRSPPATTSSSRQPPRH